MHSHTHGHVQEMGGIITASEHSRVEVLCHQRRESGNWRPRTPPGVSSYWYNPLGKQFGIMYGEPSKCSFSLLGVYPKIIIRKRTSYS